MTRTKKFDLTPIRDAIEQLAAEYNRLDDLQSNLMGDRDVVAAAMLPREEAKARYADALARLQSRQEKDRLMAEARRMARPESWRNPHDLFRFFLMKDGQVNNGLLVALLAPLIQERMFELIDRADWPAAINSDERRKKLVELDTEIERLDAEKRELLGAAQNAGLDLSYEDFILETGAVEDPIAESILSEEA